MSVASLLQMRILPLFFGFFEAIFLPAKSTRFWRPKVHFRPQSLRFRGRVMSAKTLGTRILLVSARGLLFRREVVSARLNFSAGGPKNLLLHGKNQACRALNYWLACQNLGVPHPKWMSCKCVCSLPLFNVYKVKLGQISSLNIALKPAEGIKKTTNDRLEYADLLRHRPYSTIKGVSF